MLYRPSLTAFVATAILGASLFALARAPSLRSSVRAWTTTWTLQPALSSMAGGSAPPALGDFLRGAKAVFLQASDLQAFTLCTGNVAGGALTEERASADQQISTRSHRPLRMPTWPRMAMRVGESCR